MSYFGFLSVFLHSVLANIGLNILQLFVDTLSRDTLA